MVDIASEIAAVPASQQARSQFRLVGCLTSRSEAMDYVDALATDVFSTGYQSKAFLRAWLLQPASRPFFLIFAATGHGDVLLPLEFARNGTAVYCGGTHANGNFPIGRTEDIQALEGIDQKQIVQLLRSLDKRPHVIFLERQHETFNGLRNPFVFSSSSTSPNVALSLSLEGGFSDVLSRHHGKRKRKRQRSHIRKLEEMGTIEIVQHVPCNEVRDVLDTFFRLKAARFKEQGICDVFQQEQVREMFAHLFVESCDAVKPSHQLKALKLDGKVIAVIGCTNHAGRQTVEFGTFDNAYAAGGPGDLLFYHAIEQACDEGFEIFDFGIGDEFYKRSWCEIETWHRETALAITVRGSVIAISKGAWSELVRVIKSNKIVWSNLKKLRRHVGWLRRC